MEYLEQSLGKTAFFPLPSLRLKQRRAAGASVEEELKEFLARIAGELDERSTYLEAGGAPASSFRHGHQRRGEETVNHELLRQGTYVDFSVGDGRRVELGEVSQPVAR